MPSTKCKAGRYHRIEIDHDNNGEVAGVCRRCKQRYWGKLTGENNLKNKQTIEVFYGIDYLLPGEPWFYFERMKIENSYNYYVLQAADDYVYRLPSLQAK